MNLPIQNQLMRAATLSALFASTCIIAQAQHMNASDAPCPHAQPEAGQTACFVTASKQRDKELNDFYQQVIKVLKGDHVSRLQSAQHSWLQFRDATCNAEKAMYEGGSAQPKVYYACLEAETRYRIKDLRNTYGWVIEKTR